MGVFAFSWGSVIDQRLQINSGIFLWKSKICNFRVLGRNVLNLELHAIFNPSKFYSNPNIWLFLHKSIPTVTNFVFVVAMITQNRASNGFRGHFCNLCDAEFQAKQRSHHKNTVSHMHEQYFWTRLYMWELEFCAYNVCQNWCLTSLLNFQTVSLIF